MNKLETKNTMLTLVVLATVVCLIKFLLEGVVLNIYAHTFNFGHVDASVYLAILSPILGSHSFIETRKVKAPSVNQE